MAHPVLKNERTLLNQALEIAGIDMSDRSGAGILNKAFGVLLIFVPVALIASLLFHVAGVPMFILSALGIIPLAKVLGTATEELSSRVGSGIGGLINSTFGNATELIISFFALQKGLTEVVKASLTGSILGNLLFVLGLSLFLGGLKREKQTFNRTAISASATQMTVAVIGLLVPAAFFYTSPKLGQSSNEVEGISVLMAIVLVVAYVAQLIFSLRTHANNYREEQEEALGESWPIRKSVVVLAGTAVMIGVLAELLVSSVESLTTQFGWSELFVGVILVALIGNAAENMTAVTVALKDKMNLSLGIALGSSLQLALFVAPFLVFAGAIMGGASRLTLLFNPFELISIVFAVLIVNLITQDGESNWFEGVQLLVVYAMLGVAFFLHD